MGWRNPRLLRLQPGGHILERVWPARQVGRAEQFLGEQLLAAAVTSTAAAAGTAAAAAVGELNLDIVKVEIVLDVARGGRGADELLHARKTGHCCLAQRIPC